MPRKRWIDKNNAQNFQLLYRSQDDPLVNDEATGERALFQVVGAGSSHRRRQQQEGLHLNDLEDGFDFGKMRENEGEAAEHGIYFDDTEYDYMQHLRDVGEPGTESHFVDALPTQTQGSGKGKSKTMKLEDALREISLCDDRSSVTNGKSIYDGSASKISELRSDRKIQRQQEIPDEIAGFQPDMDPRLREVLEALEDDAYVDEDDEEDIFGALGREGQHGELDMTEFEANFDDDDGWESDVTEKMSGQKKQLEMLSTIPMSTEDGVETPDAEKAVADDGDWLKDFAKFKRDSNRKPLKAADSIIAASTNQDTPPSLYTLNGTPLRRKKRKGALTNPSAYSMTSSSLARTEGQQLLDARFNQVEKMYALDEADEEDEMDGGVSLISGTTGKSKMSQFSVTSFADKDAVRGDFDGMMDGFLDDWNKTNPGGGKRRGAKGKRGRNGNEQFGLQQLDEVRAELGPARLYQRASGLKSQ